MRTLIGHTLEKEFLISDKATDLPLPPYPAFVGFCLVALCRTGWADLLVHGKPYRMNPAELLIFFPQQDAAFTQASPDFTATYIVLPQTLFHDIISMMRRFTPHFFFFIQENYVFRMSPDELVDFDSFCRLLKRRVAAPEEDLRRELVVFTFATCFMDLYQYYREKSKQATLGVNQRKEELTYEFFRLVATHYVTHKDVAFYADKMNITPTYLTIVVKQTCGLSAKEWLVEFITQKIKSKLRDPHLNMQEIALELNFPTQTAMNRFFRNYTGMSLTQYRKSITT